MRKILLSILLCTFAVATWAQTTAVKLSFTRNGQDVTVAVNDQEGNAIPGASATVVLSGSTSTWKSNGELATQTNIICPDVNANANPTITMTFTINGLSRLMANQLSLDIHAMNGGGAHQLNGSDEPDRHWNIQAQVNNNGFASYTDLEIAKGCNTGGVTHKVHEAANETPCEITNPTTFVLTITKGTNNSGCFFGLAEIVLGVEEMSEPETPTTYQFKGANLTSSQLNAATAPMYIAIKNISATNNYWFVGNTGAAPYSKAAYDEAVIFVWEPVTEGVAGSYYLKKLDGTYMQATSPKDFGTIENAAQFTATNPTSAGSGSTKFNGDAASQDYIEGSDDPKLVRLVTGSNWINVQNGDSGTPTYNTGEGGWTIHYVYELEQVEGFKANISAAKYSTMYTTYSVDLSQAEGVSAYYIKEGSFNNDYVTLTQVESNVIPAYTPVILYAENAGEYILPYTTEEGTALAGNVLQGTFVNTNVVGESYILSNPASGVGLYKVELNKKDNTAFLNNGGKAYLPASAVPAAQQVQGFKFGDFTSTAIEGVETGNTGVKVVYDLSGRRINSITTAGVYIINGKKVMVK